MLHVQGANPEEQGGRARTDVRQDDQSVERIEEQEGQGGAEHEQLVHSGDADISVEGGL